MQHLVEPLKFLKEIHNKGVKYLLIGRQAVIAYGGPVQSMDYDIYIDGSRENTHLLISIAKKFDLVPNLPQEKMYTHFKFRLENNFTLDVFRARSISISKTKTLTFNEIYNRRKILKGAAGLKINVPSIDDLIALKRLRSLPKDLQDIKYLEEIERENH